MSLFDDAIRAAKRSEEAEEAAEKERDERQWREGVESTREHRTKLLREWYGEMGIADPPDIVIENIKYKYNWDDGYLTHDWYDIEMSWQIDGRNFYAYYDGERLSLTVMIEVAAGTKSTSKRHGKYFCHARTKSNLGRALLDEQSGLGK